MKFLTLACLAASAAGGLVEPPARVYERDLATITSIINSAGQGIDNLDTAVKAFSGDPKPVQDASAALLQVLKDGKTKVDGTSNLNLIEALGLQQPVQDLQAKGEILLADLKARKADIEKNNLCDITRQQVTDINTNSKALIDAIVAKVPPAAQAIATSLAAGLVQVLANAQTEFSEQNCKNSMSTTLQGTTSTSPPETTPTTAPETTPTTPTTAPETTPTTTPETTPTTAPETTPTTAPET
ncbi:Cell wall mannoprotein 1, partial [Tolypocladium paradoxum]